MDTFRGKKSKIDESNLDSEQNLKDKQSQDSDKIDNENIDEIDLQQEIICIWFFF